MAAFMPLDLSGQSTKATLSGFSIFLLPLLAISDYYYQKENNISGRWEPDIAMVQSRQW